MPIPISQPRKLRQGWMRGLQEGLPLGAELVLRVLSDIRVCTLLLAWALMVTGTSLPLQPVLV